VKVMAGVYPSKKRSNVAAKFQSCLALENSRFRNFFLSNTETLVWKFSPLPYTVLHLVCGVTRPCVGLLLVRVAEKHGLPARSAGKRINVAANAVR